MDQKMDNSTCYFPKVRKDNAQRAKQLKQLNSQPFGSVIAYFATTQVAGGRSDDQCKDINSCLRTPTTEQKSTGLVAKPGKK
jgi:hypothetical protein